MPSIEEMLIGDVQEETEEKIDIEHGFPHLTAKSGSDEDHMSKLDDTSGLLSVMQINGLFSVMQINEVLIR